MFGFVVLHIMREGKANLSNAARKKNELLYRAGPGVQDIYENLVSVPSPMDLDGVYQECVRTLNAYFHAEENVAYEKHVLRQLKLEPGKDVDSFVLRFFQKPSQIRWLCSERTGRRGTCSTA